MLLASTDNQPKNELTYLRIFESYPVDGIVLIGTVLTDEHQEISKRIKGSGCGCGTGDRNGKLYLS